MLNDENWCVRYLFSLRWPEGFVCPTCGAHQEQSEPVKSPVCRSCGRQGSITAGTLLHGSKKRLSSWLKLIWRLSCDSQPPNIKQIQKYLDLHSYQTAWNWMAKLRLAMQLALEKKCDKTVMIDSAGSATLMGPDKSAAADRPAIDHLIIAAVESVAAGRCEGRMRLSYIRQLDSAAILAFLRRRVQPGSTIVAPDRAVFNDLKTIDYVYTVEYGRTSHESIRKLIQGYFAWYAEKGYRSTDLRHRQGYLDEFCFYQESRLAADRVQVFEHLLKAVLLHDPAAADPSAGQDYLQRGAS